MRTLTGAAATDRTIRALLKQAATTGKRVEGAHPAASGLRVRCEPTGTATFVWYGSEPGGKRRMFVLGYFPDTIARQAADKMGELKLQRRAASLTGLPMDMQLEKGPDLSGLTMRGLVARFAFKKLRRRKMSRSPLLVLKRHVLGPKDAPILGAVPVAAIQAGHLAAIVNRLRDQGKDQQASKVWALLRQAFRFAVYPLRVIAKSPAADLSRSELDLSVGHRTARLSPSELGDLWKALHASPGNPVNRAARLALAILLATGRRTGEVLKARRQDVDLAAGTWRIPVENRKSKRNGSGAITEDDLVRIPPQVVDLFRALYALAPASSWVCASPFGAADALSETALSRALRGLQTGKVVAFTQNITPHDFRRTLRSTVAEQRWCSPAAGERLLGHKLPGIVGVYDAGSYSDERATALARWADYLDALAGRTTTDVVNLDAARAVK